MAAELTTTKLNADSHLLLDQPLLRLPHELLRRNFKSVQRYVEREKDYVLPALKDTANASLSSKQTPEQTLASLDAMIVRMQSLKRKLETLHDEEEALHNATSKRIRHLEDLYQIPSLIDVKYDEWSRVRLDRLIVDYLLRTGYPKTAAELSSAKHITPLVDLDVFIQCQKIATSLSQGETKDALYWISENKSAFKKLPNSAHTPNLEFELRLQQFIDLVRQNTVAKRIEAMSHAQKYLAPHTATRTDLIFHAAGLLAQDPSTQVEPYRSLFSPSRWPYLTHLFIETHHTLLSLPTRPLLHVALSAGLSALKTPACHSRDNPANASTPGHARLATNTSLCPICSMELNELARNLPSAHHDKSAIYDDPLVLPNGRVYAAATLEDLQKKLVGGVGEIGQRQVKDPVTGEVFEWREVKKVFIP